MSIIKNTAGQYLYAVLVSSVDGSAITTGATLHLSKDGAAQGAAAGTLTHKGNGQWECALAQADTNANGIGYVWGGTNVIPQGGHIQTVDYPRTAIPAAAANANGGLPILSSSGTTLNYTLATLTTYTGNTPQTGDAFARIGLNGAGLTALGDIRLGNLDAAVSTRSTLSAGAAMTLTSGERTALAVEVESHLLDEGDSQMLINAIVGAIGNTNIDEAVLVAAIRADLERSGGNLHTLLARLTSTRAGYLDSLTNLDAAVSSRMATFVYTAPPSAATVAGAVRTELTSELERIDAAVSTRQATLTLPENFEALAITATGKVTVGTLPDPAPNGYGGTFEGDISGMTEAQDAKLTAIHQAASGGRLVVLSSISRVGSAISVRRGDSWSLLLRGLGDLTGATELWFTFKTAAGTADDTALLFVSSVDGLTVVAGAAHATTSHGSLAVEGAATLGQVRLIVDEAATLLLAAGANLRWALKARIGSDSRTLAAGTCTIGEAEILTVS